MDKPSASKTAQRVADILERELASTTTEWLRRVKLVSDLTNIPLTDGERARHLPALFDDVLWRLRVVTDAPHRVSFAAGAQGEVRFKQGYSAAMLVEESRIFQVATFGTLSLYQSELDHEWVLPDVVVIADEVDRQLTETVRSFMMAQCALYSRSV